MVGEWCFSSIRTFRTCPCRNWKTTPNQFGLKVFANKTSHYVVSWYRPPGGSSEDFQLFRDQLDQMKNKHKGNKLPVVHVLVDFNFKDIAWPDRLNKSGSMLSQSETNVDWHYEWYWFRTIGAFSNSREKHIGFNSHFSSWSISRNTFPRQT